MNSATRCTQGIYIHVNRKTGAWRVGESGNVPNRSGRSAAQNRDCLGDPNELDTFALPTCGILLF